MSQEMRRGRTGRAIQGAASTILLLLAQACNGSNGSAGDGGSPSDPDYAYERQRMVHLQLEGRGIRDDRVLKAMAKVLRHRFAPDLDPSRAYDDRPHPIGEGQTISQPYIVALMSELARVEPPCKVLEVGTGSGYQAAVLAEMGCIVYTIEIIEPLAARAHKILEAEGYADRVHGRAGDGYRGWPEEAPFDAILVTAAPDHVPEPLIEQLAEGGRMILPVGDLEQELVLLEKRGGEVTRRSVLPVRFVPMTGEARR